MIPVFLAFFLYVASGPAHAGGEEGENQHRAPRPCQAGADG